MRDALPFLPPVVVLGIVFGTSAGPAGLGPGGAVAMSAVVFSGSGQLAALPLRRGPGLLVFLSALVLSLRFALLTAFLSPLALAVSLPKILPLLLLGGRIPPAPRRWLGYVAPAALSALVAPAVLGPPGRGPDAWYGAGYLLAALVAMATRRVLWAVGAGMAVILAGAVLSALT